MTVSNIDAYGLDEEHGDGPPIADGSVGPEAFPVIQVSPAERKRRQARNRRRNARKAIVKWLLAMRRADTKARKAQRRLSIADSLTFKPSRRERSTFRPAA